MAQWIKVLDIMDHIILFVQIQSLYPPPLQICFWLFQAFSSVSAFPLSKFGVHFFRVSSRFSYGSFAFWRRHSLLWGHAQNSSRRLLSVGFFCTKFYFFLQCRGCIFQSMLNRVKLCLVSLTLSYGLFLLYF